MLVYTHTCSRSLLIHHSLYSLDLAQLQKCLQPASLVMACWKLFGQHNLSWKPIFFQSQDFQIDFILVQSSLRQNITFRELNAQLPPTSHWFFCSSQPNSSSIGHSWGTWINATFGCVTTACCYTAIQHASLTFIFIECYVIRGIQKVRHLQAPTERGWTNN